MDAFASHRVTLTSPPENAAAVTPDDVADLPSVSRAVYVGTGGDLRVRMSGSGVVTIPDVPGGSFLPIRVRQVLRKGTSATGLVIFW
jgi:hypothetical protein